MEVRKRTPRTDLQYSGIYHKLNGFAAEVAKELDVDEVVARSGLDIYIELSTRVDFAPGEVDFETAAGTDSAEDIQRKFRAYLDSETAAIRDRALVAMNELDRPADAAFAPLPPEAEADPGN